MTDKPPLQRKLGYQFQVYAPSGLLLFIFILKDQDIIDPEDFFYLFYIYIAGGICFVIFMWAYHRYNGKLNLIGTILKKQFRRPSK